MELVSSAIGRLAILLLAFIFCWSSGSAHVALTFPPARQPAWDFLDSGRTPAPCGVPKGTLRTSILSGSTFNVTWHLGYPHRGGYRIQVLDKREKPVLDLTVGRNGSAFVDGDATALNYEVFIPKDFECRDCTVRLIRQATEWGKHYMFWSCADVDIIPRGEYKETCSGHGKDLAGRCRCEPLYSGHRCQYRDECAEDRDCGRHGKCINLEATSYPKKQCFCEMGWFGPQCNKQSPVKDPSIINYADYNKEVMSDAYELYWRVLRNSQELEAVMVVKGGSYAAVGWRPLDLTATCKGFPLLEDLTPAVDVNNGTHQEETSAAPEPEPEPSPEPEPEPSAEPEPVPEPSPEPSTVPTTSSTTTEATERHDEIVFPTAKHIDGNVSDALIESPTEARPAIVQHQGTIRPLTQRPKVPVQGRSPLAPKTAATTTKGTTTTTTSTSTTPSSEEVDEDEVEESTTTTTVATTTKKLSPLEKLIAKNKLAASRASSTTPETVAAPAEPILAARGSVTRLKLSDLPEAGVNTGVGGRRTRREAAEELDADEEEEIVSSLADAGRQARQNRLSALFPGPRNAVNMPASSLVVPPASPRISAPRTDFSPQSGSDGWIPMSPNVPASFLVPPPVADSAGAPSNRQAAPVIRPANAPLPARPSPPIGPTPVRLPAPPSANPNDRVDTFDEEEDEPKRPILVLGNLTPIVPVPQTRTPAAAPKPAPPVVTQRPATPNVQPTTEVVTTSTRALPTPTTPLTAKPSTIAVSVAVTTPAVPAASGQEEAAPEPTPEVEAPVAEPEPSPEPESSPEPEPEAAKPEPEPSAEPEPEPAAEPEPEPEPEANKPVKSDGDQETKGTEHDHHGMAPSEAPQGYKPPHKYAPRADFHSMDCTDIIIGMARGNYSRIGDFYTRDRSTPQPDVFYGGRQDLTAALGFERDGQTIILFRRKLNSSDEADHTIGFGAMHVIWARGQEHGKYVHSPPSGLEVESASIAEFYRPDELKYHGKGDQRGVTVITFLEPPVKAFDGIKNDSQSDATSDHSQHHGAVGSAGSGNRHLHKGPSLCGGEWKYPVTCDPTQMDCTYYAKWEYLEYLDQIRFTITANQTNRWVAIGFGESTSMPQTDLVLGWVDPNGRVFIGDMWALGYTAPKLDDTQNLLNVSGQVEDGKTTISFTRQRITKDEQDVQFTDDNCLYFKFPVAGGTRNTVSKKIGKHLQTPFISSDRICIRSCGQGGGGPNGISYTTTPAPPKIMYNVGLKMVGLANDFEVPQAGSQEFNELAKRFSRQVENALQAGKVPGFEEVVVTEFAEEDGGLVAHMSVVLDKKAADEFERSSELKVETNSIVKSTLQGAIATGQMGSIRVDPTYLQFESLTLDSAASDPLEVTTGRGWNSSLTTISLYCVIAAIVVLVIIAVIQASCTIYKVSRKSPSAPNKVNLDFSPLPNNKPMTSASLMHQQDQAAVNWRDYSSTNYAYEPFETDEALRAAAVMAANGTNGHTVMSASTTGPPSRATHRPASTDSMSKMDRDAYSLPRGHQQPPLVGNGHSNGGQGNGRPRTHSSTSIHQPDFYFMPSQRRYSGYPEYQ